MSRRPRGWTITIDGITRRAVDVAKEHGINASTLAQRIKYGWDEVRAATERPEPRKRVRRVNGEVGTVAALARAHGLTYATAVSRIERGQSLSDPVRTYRDEHIARELWVGVTATELAWIESQPEKPPSRLLRRLITEAMARGT